MKLAKILSYTVNTFLFLLEHWFHYVLPKENVMFLECKSFKPSYYCFMMIIILSLNMYQDSYIHNSLLRLNWQFFPLISCVCENLFSFLYFPVIRNILMFSNSERKRRRLLKNDRPRYITLFMQQLLFPCCEILLIMFSSISCQ